MSGTVTAPPLSASGTDPLIAPPAPPPVNASNDPTDRANGAAGEMSATEQAEAAAARREPAAPEPAAEQPAEAAATEPPATEKPPPKPDTTPPAIKAEITKERNRRREAEAAAEAAQKRLDEALEAIKALTPKPPPEPVVQPRPRREQFDTPDAYDAAVDQWAAMVRDQAANEAKAATLAEAKAAQEKALTDAREAAARADQEALATTWAERRAKALETMPDYEAVAESDNVQISPPMAEAIMRSENGTEIAYHLGQNPAEAARIAALPNVGAQLFEMGRLWYVEKQW